MLRKSLYLAMTLTLTLPSSILADDPAFQHKGYKLTDDAWIFSPNKAKEVRDKLIDLDTETKTNDSLMKSLSLQKDMSDLQEKKLQTLAQQNDRLTQTVSDNRAMSDWHKIMWFTLGVVVTGLAVYGAKALTK